MDESANPSLLKADGRTMGLRVLRLLLSSALLAVGFFLPEGTTAQPPPHFYALGRSTAQPRQSALYKVHTETKHVLASLDLSQYEGPVALSSDGGQVLVMDGNKMFLFDADRFGLRDQFAMVSKEFPWSYAGTLFAHPQSGLLYIARWGGSNPDEIAIVDPRSRKVVKVLKLKSTITGGFIYDSKRDRLYVTAASPAVLDPRTQRVLGYIKLSPRDTVFEMHLSRDGNQLFLRGEGTNLYVYDLDRAMVVRRSGPFPPSVTSIRDLALSHDGTRVFAVASAGGDRQTAVVIDSQTLTILHTLTFQEPIGGFLPAPDGRGMWVMAKNGVLRVDARTGQMLESVSLPFQLTRLILPP